MHTKGPWKVDRLRSIYQESDTESQDRIAEAFVMARREKNINDPSLVIQAQANAHLIGEAPAMLEALESLLAHLWDGRKRNVKEDYSLMVAEVAAQKAIWKAKGG
jgi:hypothetical protein